ncbi:hypothetical protein TWF281_001479 [Arthrobotrys megalospora]
MDPIRQNSHVQQPFPYGTATPAPTDNSNYSTVQFSDPWKGGANPTSAPYAGMPNPASLATAQSDLGGLKQPLRQNNFIPNAGYPATYAEQTSTTSPTARATANYTMNGYGSYDQTSAAKNNLQSSLVDYTRPGVTAGSYHTADTLDATRGMLALGSQPSRFSLPHVGHRTSSSASSSSYYPQSTSSSISSASSYPYYSGSMDSAGTDITSISDMYDSARPNLPRPAGLISSHHLFGHQSGQAAMMGQFNSRVQSNTTKKHKCKICDKRFTRPSSLQTHMYSHTGEKPFACEVEGCGRQFSVVSNLRRHRKVHKPTHSDTETVSNAGSV